MLKASKTNTSAGMYYDLTFPANVDEPNRLELYRAWCYRTAVRIMDKFQETQIHKRAMAISSLARSGVLKCQTLTEYLQDWLVIEDADYDRDWLVAEYVLAFQVNVVAAVERELLSDVYMHDTVQVFVPNWVLQITGSWREVHDAVQGAANTVFKEN